MALTNAWNEAVPTDENYGFELDDYLRQLALNVRERIGVQHKTYSDETGHTDVGEHKPGECNVVFVGAKASFPVPATSNAGCFAVATDETNQIYYWNGTGWAKVQEPMLITGDQTIAGAKTFSGAVTIQDAATLSAISSIKDGSVMSTSGAPTEDAMIANKKYVDDAIDATVGAGVMSPLAYTSDEQSITLPNGFIIKQGSVAYQASQTLTVTFDDAFPNTAIRALITLYHSVAGSFSPVVSSLTKTALAIKTSSGAGTSISWLAIGR